MIKAAYKNWCLRVLNRQAVKWGYKLIKEKPRSDAEIVITDFFKTGYRKNALLSYLIYPFTGSMQNNHSNHRECYTIAEILKELGYNVDVINWDNNTFIPSKKYDLVIDNHNNLERLSPYLDGQTKKIFHATNAHWLYQNSIEYNRCHRFFLKTGVAIEPKRQMSPGHNAECSDVISMFGNDFTKRTYGLVSSKIHHLPMSVTSVPEILNNRNYATAKTKFVWLNSHGALLKGLDVIIDAFTILPDMELHILGDMEREAKFMNAISCELHAAPNIKFEGWIDINESHFKEIATGCAWVIGASFSEGGGGSILNCMAKGLIPVISRSSSISLPEKTGFYVEENNATGLVALLKIITTLPAAELQAMSSNAYNFIAANHTLENFKARYKEFLIQTSQPEVINHD